MRLGPVCGLFSFLQLRRQGKGLLAYQLLRGLGLFQSRQNPPVAFLGRRYPLWQLAPLPLACQHLPTSRIATLPACHRATGAQDLAGQRHDLKSASQALEGPARSLQVAGEYGAAQKHLHHRRQPILGPHQIGPHAHDALLRGHIQPRHRSHRIQRQKGNPPAFPFSQKSDRRLGVGPRLHHDVLQVPAQGHLDGNLVFRRHVDQLCDGTGHAG